MYAHKDVARLWRRKLFAKVYFVASSSPLETHTPTHISPCNLSIPVNKSLRNKYCLHSPVIWVAVEPQSRGQRNFWRFE